MKSQIAIFICLLCLSLPAAADDLYKWVDKNGVTHYGDAIPAEASTQERHVLNRHGVTVKVLDRQKTIAELNAMAAAAARMEQEKSAEQMQAERDRVLLDTYLSAREIEMLRDRRVLAIEARLGVTRHYLENLRAEWDELEVEVAEYNFPYDANSELPALPEELAERIVFTENAMAEHMSSLRELRTQQSKIRSRFERDISRFKLLKEQELASVTP
ncbi:MAG: DUF4124 domain-containing protein [Gammaproteobacteria bacterium]|nr:DUF4124 domain-containing protein [Gammaproteobacteria bacterium]MDH3766849.1 DUF4124 domain-containing protein [Gammaproteobacteria bacterium]